MAKKYTIVDLSEKLGLSTTYIQKLVKDKTFPKPAGKEGQRHIWSSEQLHEMQAIRNGTATVSNGAPERRPEVTAPRKKLSDRVSWTISDVATVSYDPSNSSIQVVAEKCECGGARSAHMKFAELKTLLEGRGVEFRASHKYIVLLGPPGISLVLPKYQPHQVVAEHHLAAIKNMLLRIKN